MYVAFSSANRSLACSRSPQVARDPSATTLTDGTVLVSYFQYRTQAVGKMHFTPTYLDVGFEEMFLAEQDGPGRHDDDYHRWLREEGISAAELLAELARITGGSSFRARDADALEKVFDTIDELEKTEFTSTRLVHYRERFEPWAVAALVALLLAAALEGVAGRTPW